MKVYLCLIALLLTLNASAKKGEKCYENGWTSHFSVKDISWYVHLEFSRDNSKLLLFNHLNKVAHIRDTFNNRTFKWGIKKTNHTWLTKEDQLFYKVEFSKDGKHAIGFAKRKLEVLNVTNYKSKVLYKGKERTYGLVIKGTDVILLIFGKKLCVYTVRHGKRRCYSFPTGWFSKLETSVYDNDKFIDISPDKQKVAISVEHLIVVIDIYSGKVKKFKLPKLDRVLPSRRHYRIRFAEDNETLALKAEQDSRLYLYNIRSKKLKKGFLTGKLGGWKFSKDSKKLVIFNISNDSYSNYYDYKVHFYNTDNMTEISEPIELIYDGSGFSVFSDNDIEFLDKNRMIIISKGIKNLLIVDVEKSKISYKTFLKKISDYVIRGNQTVLLLGGKYSGPQKELHYPFQNKTITFTATTRNKEILNIVMSQDASMVSHIQFSSNVTIKTLDRVCIKGDLKVEKCKDIECGTEGMDWLTRLSLKKLCKSKFDENSWDRITPKIKGNRVKEEDLLLYLHRFQKVGGFDENRNMKALIAILKTKFKGRTDELLAGAMQNVLYESEAIYEKLIKEHPFLKKLKPGKSVNACRTKSEANDIKLSVKNYLNRLKKNTPQRIKFDYLSKLVPLIPVLTSFSKKEREEYMDFLAERLSAGAADSGKYSGVFLSKLFKLCYQAIAGFFGLNKKQVTDFTVIRSRNSITLMVLGIYPIDGDTSTLNKFGFYSKKLKTIFFKYKHKKGTIILNGSFSWKHNKKTYKAILKVKTSKSKINIPTGTSPDYTSLWKDGALTGFIIAGKNLGQTELADFKESYMEFFKDRGFLFETLSRNVKNIKNLEQKTISGEIDYFIKAAHSDGDEKNLFRLPEKGQQFTGVRKISATRKEVVYIVIPDRLDGSPGTLLPNLTFGSWLRKREKHGGGQFIYIDVSCWSVTKAICELEAAKSKLFVKIASPTSVFGFTNQKDDAIGIILDGIRKQYSYKKIRDVLKKENKHYKSQKDDWYIFPDESEYNQQIIQVLKVPLDIDLKIYDSSGKPYNIDQVR